MSTKPRLLWSILIFCAAVAFVAQPALAAEKTLKVGVYGGYFKDSFDKHIFPDFTKETGIKVESVAEPTGEAWLVQLEQAAKAGSCPGRRQHDRSGAHAERPEDQAVGAA